MAHELTSRLRQGGERSGVALEEPGESLEVVLSSAFTAPEEPAAEDLPPESPEAAPGRREIDPLLLKVVPPPKPIDFHALEEESSRHRLILMRTGAVISVAALVSIVGAFLYHAMILGVLWAGAMLMPVQDRGGSRGAALETGGGLMTTEAPSGPSAAPATPPGATPPAAMALPQVPPVVQPLPSPNQVAMNTFRNDEPAPDIIAIPGGETALGHLKEPVPPRPTTVPPPEPMILPPNHTDLPSPAAPVSSANTPASNASVMGAGGTGDDEEAPISLLRDGAGSGTDGRSGRGHGHLMGGDLPEPGPLETPDLAMRLVSPPKHDHMTYDVTVAADGTVMDVKLKESSGEADLDELWRLQILRNWKFRAAHVNGKFIQASTSIIIRLTAK
jgi:TonB family protein